MINQKRGNPKRAGGRKQNYTVNPTTSFSTSRASRARATTARRATASSPSRSRSPAPSRSRTRSARPPTSCGPGRPEADGHRRALQREVRREVGFVFLVPKKGERSPARATRQAAARRARSCAWRGSRERELEARAEQGSEPAILDRDRDPVVDDRPRRERRLHVQGQPRPARGREPGAALPPDRERRLPARLALSRPHRDRPVNRSEFGPTAGSGRRTSAPRFSGGRPP